VVSRIVLGSCAEGYDGGRLALQQIRGSPPKNLRQTSTRLPVKKPDSFYAGLHDPWPKHICRQYLEREVVRCVSIVSQKILSTVKTTSFHAKSWPVR
jgi:hypothetical protein